MTARGRGCDVLVTGGAGFIGTNLVARLAVEGRHVRILDNLSRPGVENNLRWLLDSWPDIEFVRADLRDGAAVREAVRGARRAYHLGAQVAVTTSLEAPRHDFEVNLLGTLNLLEALRADGTCESLLFASTNKVYGCLEDLPLEEWETRYAPADEGIRLRGISESRPLSFHTPYGCSKGAADQYVLDYARYYGLPATVVRMSCIYGPHQMGTEDQGWLAHFLIRALRRQPITLYGDGKQVRDVLFVNDLIDAYCAVPDHIVELSGHAYNIGGGASNCLSLNELLALMARAFRLRPAVDHGDWRDGDQRYYVSDTAAFSAVTGWSPAVSPEAGVTALHDWLAAELAGRAPQATAVRA